MLNRLNKLVLLVMLCLGLASVVKWANPYGPVHQTREVVGLGLKILVQIFLSLLARSDITGYPLVLACVRRRAELSSFYRARN